MDALVCQKNSAFGVFTSNLLQLSVILLFKKKLKYWWTAVESEIDNNAAQLGTMQSLAADYEMEREFVAAIQDIKKKMYRIVTC